MTHRSAVLLGWIVLGAACGGPSWQPGRGLMAKSRLVAAALGDPVELARPFDPASVPVFPPPRTIRPCCVFGMDLKAQVGVMRIPGYQIGNITAVSELGPHEYDNGAATIESFASWTGPSYARAQS